MENSLKAMFRCSAAILIFLALGFCAEQKSFREEARFGIYVGGREIGQEKFSIQGSGDSVVSRSESRFRDPGNNQQTVKIETDSSLDGSFVPRSYQIRTDVNGRKGMLKGSFSQGQVEFEYLADESPRKTGLLVGDRYLILDTNVFHHFVFVARSFDFVGKEKSQPMEVLIPQEFENGLLKVSNLGSEKVSIKGKNRELQHLKADTGLVQIDLWVDSNRILHKIALPARRIEVIRD